MEKDIKRIGTEELKDLLLKDFPILFKENSIDYCLTDPILCRRGWNGMIYNLSQSLNDILADYVRLYPSARIKVNQIKEKFGRLSYYANIDGLPKNHKEMLIFFIKEKTNESKITCENCGNFGQLRNDLKWVRTYCDRCYNENLDNKFNTHNN